MSENTEPKNRACTYTGVHFGAAYPDAVCIDGLLWDLDSCAEPGGPLRNGGEIPCPTCNHESWLEHARDQIENDGYLAADRGLPAECCPWPERAVKNPMDGLEQFAAADGEKFKEFWMSGWRECHADATPETQPSKAKPLPVQAVAPVTETLTTDRNDPGLREHRPDGQQEKYLVLSAEERAQGFVRPVRTAYRHLACRSVTTMGLALSETYARKPDFYDGTYCCKCGTHFNLIDLNGERAFVWLENDGREVAGVGE